MCVCVCVLGRGKAQGLAKDSKLVEQQQEQPLKEKSAEQCLKFSEASRVVKPHYGKARFSLKNLTIP